MLKLMRYVYLCRALLLLLGTTAMAQETVSITHAEGVTEAPVNPQRVVIVGEALLEMAWVLDLPVVGLAPGEAPIEQAQSIAPDFFASSFFADSPYGDVTLVGSWLEPSLEAILALDPDLIIRQYWGQEGYEQLSAIAPTLSIDEAWRTGLPQLAPLVRGGAERVAEATRSVDETYADLRARLTEAGVFASQPHALVLSPFAGGAVYVSFGDHRIAGIMNALGFDQKLPPSITELEGDSAVISDEAILQIPADTLIVAIAHDTFDDKTRSLKLMEDAAGPVIRHVLVPMQPWTGPRSDVATAQALTEEILKLEQGDAANLN